MAAPEIERLLDATTTTAACDVLMRKGLRAYMRSRIRSLDPTLRLAGPAMTIRRKPVALLPKGGEKPRDPWLETIAGASPGSVLVIVSDADVEAVTVEARDQEAAKRILAGAGLLETMKSLGRG